MSRIPFLPYTGEEGDLAFYGHMRGVVHGAQAQPRRIYLPGLRLYGPLWCLLIIPGPFYSYWRRQGGEVECAGCADGYIVKVDSKLGMVMLENKLRGTEKRKPIIRKN